MFLESKVVGNHSKVEILLNRHLSSQRSHYVEVGPKKFILPGKFQEIYDHVQRFEIRDDDVFIFGFLKTGSRLMQEMIWLLLNDLNFETASKVIIEMKVPYFEFECYWDNLSSKYPRLHQLEQFKSPRCMKTHLPWFLAPEAIRNSSKQPKIIATLRAPEDVCTSYYYQSLSEGYTGTWDEFCEIFLEGKVPFGPFWEHVLNIWEQRHRPNIMFVKYSDMVYDLRGTIQKVAAFVGKTLTNEELEKMCQHLSFDNLKKSAGFILENPSDSTINPYARKGIVGDHKNVMSPEVIEKFRKQNERYFSGTTLTF